MKAILAAAGLALLGGAARANWLPDGRTCLASDVCKAQFLAMSDEDFDQHPGPPEDTTSGKPASGWRVLAPPNAPASAGWTMAQVGDLIDYYIQNKKGLDQSAIRTLNFHAAQMYLLGADNPADETRAEAKALAHFQAGFDNNDNSDSNAYVKATIDFLTIYSKHLLPGDADRVALEQEIKQIRARIGPDTCHPFFCIMKAYAEHLGHSYADAFKAVNDRSYCPKPPPRDQCPQGSGQ